MLFWLVGAGALLITGGMVWSAVRIESNIPIGLMVIGMIIILGGSAFAHDHDRPGLNDWFKGLSAGGVPCCDGSDATRLNDVDWESKDGHYRVRIYGQWVDVPDTAVIKGPNLAGEAMVWPWYMNGKPAVRCFMPGSMT